MTDIIIKDDESSEAIARRIKSARSIGGLTRKDIEQYDISPHTLQAWELGRNPLNMKSAERLVEALDKAGIEVTAEWILKGIGFGPRIKSEASGAVYRKPVSHAKDIDWDIEKIIQEEIDTFFQLNKDAKIIMVADDSMEPIYHSGDYVAGCQLTGDAIENALGHDCIVDIEEGTFFRRFIKRKDGYALTSLNPNTSVTEPVFFCENVLSVAPVVWHRTKFFVE